MIFCVFCLIFYKYKEIILYYVYSGCQKCSHLLTTKSDVLVVNMFHGKCEFLNKCITVIDMNLDKLYLRRDNYILRIFLKMFKSITLHETFGMMKILDENLYIFSHFSLSLIIIFD